MAFFKKNPNETAYAGGKKHWADVIKNTSPGNVLIWKQPEEDFNTNSTLIVNPGEKALFVNGGVIEETFDNGTYKLSTGNYPFISRLRNAFTGGISTFNCFVYFVRCADSQELKWGTETPIQVRDKVWGVRADVRARGAYKVRIVNPNMLLEKLLGSNIDFLQQSGLSRYFSTEFQGRIKSTVSKYLNELQTELIGIDEHIEEISEQIQPKFENSLEEYGLKCVMFMISGLDVDKSKYDNIDEAQVEAVKLSKIAQGQKAEMDILGEGWAQRQQAEIMKTIAANQGAGGFTAMGAGLGMGVAAGSAFGNMAGQMMGSAAGGAASGAASAGAAQGAAEAPAAEAPAAAAAPDPIETLKKLKTMLDAGLIEQAEYDAKKADILSKM